MKNFVIIILFILLIICLDKLSLTHNEFDNINYKYKVLNCNNIYSNLETLPIDPSMLRDELEFDYFDNGCDELLSFKFE